MAVEIVKAECSVVRARGEIDLVNADEFQRALVDTFEASPGGFVVDLSDVVYIDSAGMQALLAAYSSVHQADGRLAVVVKSPNVKEIISFIHPEKLPGFLLCDDVPAAAKAISTTAEDRE